MSVNVSAAVNHPPTATAQSPSTPEDTTTVITLAGSDSDGDTLTFAKASDPAHGTVTITSGGSATYSPAANYTGEDSFTFTVSDGPASAPATVTINVTPVNDAPSATEQNVTTAKETTTVVTLAGADVDGDTLTFAKASNPAHVTVSVTAAGSATYTPAANYHGPDPSRSPSATARRPRRRRPCR